MSRILPEEVPNSVPEGIHPLDLCWHRSQSRQEVSGENGVHADALAALAEELSKAPSNIRDR
jgi:hypothetical protein